MKEYQEIQLLDLRIAAGGKSVGKAGFRLKNLKFDLRVQRQKSRLKTSWEVGNMATGATHRVTPSAACSAGLLSWQEQLMLLHRAPVVFTPGRPSGNVIRDLSLGGLLDSRARREDLCPELSGSVMTLAPCSYNFDPLT